MGHTLVAAEPLTGSILFLISLIGAAAGAFGGSYLKERGKNLATKKDIEALTDAVERIRSDYKKEEHRYQLTLSGLLKKQAEAIEQLYRMMVDTEEAYQKAVDLFEWEDQPKDVLRKKAGASLYEFVREYKKSRIYFSDDLCEKLQGFEKSIYQEFMRYSIALTSKLKAKHQKISIRHGWKQTKRFKQTFPKPGRLSKTNFVDCSV